MEKVKVEFDEKSESLKTAKGSVWERISFLIMLIVPVFLLPIFFIPSPSVPFQFSKMILLSLSVFTVFVLWILGRLKDGSFDFPATWLLPAGALVFLLSALSGVFGVGAFRISLFGQGLEMGTLSSLLVMFLTLFLASVAFRSKDRILYAYLSFYAVFFIVALFQALRLFFGPSFLAMGIFTDVAANSIGKWNDLGVFFGLSAVLSLITIELISFSKFFRVLIYLALIASIFFVAIVNFPIIWYALALFALVFLVYQISFDRSESVPTVTENDVEAPSLKKFSRIGRMPAASLFVLLVSIVFILAGAPIGNAIANKFNINQIEARPSWSATYSVGKNALLKDPLFGPGPNSFTNEWLLYKPAGINNTLFWNTDFSYGIGLIPTLAVSGGFLGILGWIIFLAIFLYTGFKTVLSSAMDKFSRYLVSSSFLVSLFLWIFNIFYTPSAVIVALSFFFTGLFVASLCQARIIGTGTLDFISNPRKSFVSVLTLVLLLVGTVALGYFFVQKFIAAVNLQKGVLAFNNEGNIDKAEQYIAKAAAFDDNDLFYRFLTEIGIMRMSNLLSQNNKNISADTIRNQFQNLLGSALNNAQKAVSIDGNNYQNWVSLGRVYEAVVPLRIDNAYESAANAYKKASALNPASPALLLSLARLAMAKADIAGAKSYVVEALKEKSNYTEAIFLLSQVQVQEGNIKDAISSVEAASLLSPNDSTIYFQLGLLRYNNKDFQGTVNALEKAVAITPSYANAKYFLGLSYYQIGKMRDAIAQFKDLKITNPDNKEVDLILSNLSLGMAPFANATPPIDNKPEKRGKPPVKEKVSSSKQFPAGNGKNSGDATLYPDADAGL